ncbi:MAG: uridine monophosphate kinase [Alphaproteobacteria bacterium]|nr:uridine monophosphate kinase [Alphaproteobacteria bacterium]
MTKNTRILLKISGESLSDASGIGIDNDALEQTARKLINIAKTCEVAVVCGGGNIMRGKNFIANDEAQNQKKTLPRADADKIGMMATILNITALQSMIGALALGKKAKILSSIEVAGIAQGFNRLLGLNALESGKILLLAGGLGQPYFTTDTTCVVRGLELDCDYVVKATKVDGVYDDDPVKNPKAKHYKHLTYQTALDKDLKIMDKTAFTIAQTNNLKIAVLSFNQENPLKNLLNNDGRFTIISN